MTNLISIFLSSASQGVLWALLAAALAARPYSHHHILHFPGLSGSGIQGSTGRTCSSRGEKGGDTSPRVEIG